MGIRPMHSAQGNPIHRFLGGTARALSILISLKGPDQPHLGLSPTSYPCTQESRLSSDLGL